MKEHCIIILIIGSCIGASAGMFFYDGGLSFHAGEVMKAISKMKEAA